MIKIVAKARVLENNIDNFINISKTLIEESRKEEGCIYYSLHKSLDGKYLTFIEEWKSMEAIDYHNNTEHFKSIVPQLLNLIEGDFDAVLYEEV